MKILVGSLMLALALAGCISSSRPASPTPAATVVIPANSGTVVICSDGSTPPCS